MATRRSTRSARTCSHARPTVWTRVPLRSLYPEPISPDDYKLIEDMAGYVVRNPLFLKRLVYIDGKQAVIPACALRAGKYK